MDDPEYGEVLDELKSKLLKLMKDTDDPLLKYGHRVPKPKGAMVNPLDCVSPRTKDFEKPEDSDYSY